MSILGIGIDVVHIPRILAIVRRRGALRFVSRILSPQEASEWHSLPSDTTPFARARFLAVRWSVKEAAYKALFPTMRPTWKELTYCNDGASPKPLLLYLDFHKSAKFHVSVSHDGEYVFSSVVAETL